MKTVETFQIGFSAAHFYKVSDWSREQNQDTFGACFSAHGHGHDYLFRVSFSSGDLTEESRTRVKNALLHIQQKFDHKHLNLNSDISDDFKSRVPTTENVLVVLTERMKDDLGELISQSFVGAELLETPLIKASWGKTSRDALISENDQAGLATFESLTVDCILQSGVPYSVKAWFHSPKSEDRKLDAKLIGQVFGQCQTPLAAFEMLNADFSVPLIEARSEIFQLFWSAP